MNYYDSASYAYERLNKTIVNTSKGVPIYLDYCRGGGAGAFDPDEDEPEEMVDECEFRAYTLKDRELLIISLKEIDLTPVKLGYVNFTDYHALYFSRTPIRNWKQGLCVNNLVISGHTDDQINVNFPAWELHNTILRCYPSYEECIENSFVTAFCPNFATSKEGILYHKAKVVGEGKSLYDPYFYLEQHLNECLEGDYAD